jgi:hypothetical protein
MQSNNKKNKEKGYGLLRESRDFQWLLQGSRDFLKHQKCSRFVNIQHDILLTRITLL